MNLAPRCVEQREARHHEPWRVHAIIIHLNASEVETAVGEMYRKSGNIVLSQVRNGTGYARNVRTADMLAISTWPSRGLFAEGIEIKVSRSDLQSELANPAKADDIARFCRYWWLATPKGLADTLTIPATWGLIEIDATRKDDGTCKLKSSIGQKATVLEPQPMDTLFVCSVLRSFSETHVLKSEIQKRIDEAVKKGVEQRISDRGSRLSEMEAAIATFKERSGIDLMSDYGRISWEVPAIADAVKLILDMRGRPLEEMAKARSALNTGVAAIDAAVGDLLKTYKP